MSDYSKDPKAEKEDEIGEWIETVAFEHGQIREVVLKKVTKSKKSKDDSDQEDEIQSIFKTYKLLIMIGTHRIESWKLSSRGKLRLDENLPGIPGRIIKFKNDDHYSTGMLLLCDSSAASKEYKDVGLSKLYTFPHLANEKAEVTLWAVKYGSFSKLTDSGSCAALRFDSYFKVMEANKAVFEKKQAINILGKEEEDDDVTKAFRDKEYIKVVAITSDSN